MNFWTDITNAFLPEAIIFGFILINLLFAVLVNKKYYKTSQWVAVLGVLSAFASLGSIQAEPVYHAFSDNFICNVFTVFFKSLILIASFFVILISNKIVRRKRTQAFLYFALLFGGVLGAMLLVSANNFLSLFLSLIMMICSCSFLIGNIKKYTSKEGALKYYTSGILSVVIFLLGMSYIYGFAGTLNFDSMSANLNGYAGSMLFTVASLLMLAGLSFPIMVVPFASWASEAYSSASHPTGMFLSLVPVFAGFGVLSRVVILLKDFVPWLSETVIVLALITIFFGAYGAIRQSEMKSFLAFSSTLHSGFLLLVMGVLSPYSLAGLLYYLICYCFMNIAIWAGVTGLYNINGRKDIASYSGLAYSHPFFTIMMVFVILSLAGLPPTSGFLAKFFVFSSIARLGFLYIIFLLVALLLSVVAVCAYIRPVRVMFERSNMVNFSGKMVFSKFAFYFCGVITVLLCLYSSKIVEICELIAYSL